MTYREYEIEKESFGYVVHYCGDDVVFNTRKEAKEFIDEIHTEIEYEPNDHYFYTEIERM